MKYNALRVLLVEDNRLEQRLLQESLTQAHVPGFAVTVVERLDKAISLAGEMEFDLLLLDLNLPDSRGIDTVKSALVSIPRLPIVVMSVLDDEETALQAVALGAQDYLIKGEPPAPMLVRTLRYAVERQKLRAAMDNSQAHMRRLIASNADGMVVTDLNGVVRFANPAAATLLNRPLEMLPGSPLNVKAQAENATETTEIEVGREAGGTDIIEARSSPIEWEGESAVLVSLRNNNEYKWREMQQRYAFIVDSSQDMMSLINRDYTYAAVNRALCTAHAKSLEDILNKPLRETWGEDVFRQEIKPHLDQCFSGRPVRYQTWLHLPQSGKGYFDIAFNPYRDETGEVLQVVAISREITEQEEFAAALIESEERLHRFSLAAVEGLVITQDGVIKDVNEQFAEMVGDQPSNLLDIPVIGFAAPEYRQLVEQRIKTNFEGTYEFSVLRRDGTTFPVEVNARMMSFRGETVRVTSVRDLTVRKRNEDQVKRAERALKTLSALNQAIVRATDESELVQEACRIGTEIGDYRLVWVGYAQDDPEKSIRKVAWAGHSQGYVESLRLSWADDSWGQGPVSQTIRTGHTVIVQSIESDPRMAMVRESALARGYRSLVSLPLRSEGQVFGALALYADEANVLDQQEIELLQELVDDLAFGIETLRVRAENRRSQEELRRSKEKFQHFFEYGNDPILIIDSETRRLVDVNERAVSHLGYERGELIGMPVTDLDAASSPADLSASIREMETYGQVRLEHSHRRKDGREVPVEISSRTVDYGEGPVHLSFVRDISERKRATEAAARAAARTEALLHAANRLNAKLNLEDTLLVVCEEAVHAIGVSAASVSLYDRASESLRYAADYGLPSDYRERHLPVPLSLFAERLNDPDPILLDVFDIKNSSDLVNRDLFIDMHINAILGIALIRDGELLGALNVFAIGDDRHFTPEDIKLGEGLGVQAAQAISNARLFAETRNQVLRQESLNRIIEAAAGAGSISQLLDQCLKQTSDLFDIEIAAIWVNGERVLKGVTPEMLEDIQRTYSVHQLEFSEPFWIDYISRVERLHTSHPVASIVVNHEIRSFVAVPISAADHRVGGLSLATAEPRHWSDKDVLLIEAIARQLGTAVDRLNLASRNLLQTRLMQKIVETVPEGLVVLDSRQQIKMANRAAQRYLAELTGAESGTDTVLETLGVHRVDKILSHSSSSGIWHEIETNPPGRIFEVAAQTLEDETSPGWILILRDVSETRERQRYEQLQERLAAVGELAAGIAHDFNNSLGAIVLFAQMLAENAHLTARQREGVEMIRSQAHHATTLVHQILDFSRRSVIELAPLELLSFTKEILKLLERTLPETIELSLEYNQNLYMVKGNPTSLQQVLLNLAVNARDAMPNGGSLTLRFDKFNLHEHDRPPVPDMQPGAWMSLAVSDTGTGIDPHLMHRLFEPFFTTKETGKGTGLGLAQVYGIIAQHSGFIHVDSRPGQGSTFTIYLPVDAQDAITPSSSLEAPVSGGGAETILLVEDNPSTAQAVLFSLESLGYSVLTASNGEEALEQYREHPDDIDLILSDMVMPRMGGVELYRRIQQENPELRMIIMTGYPMEDDGRDLLEQGIVDWILKPFEIDVLDAKLRRAFEI